MPGDLRSFARRGAAAPSDLPSDQEDGKDFMRTGHAILTTLLLCLAGAAAAQPAANDDHALFGGFPDAAVSEYETLAGVNHRVVLGSLQSSRGQVVPEAQERVRGDLTRILYEVADGFSGQEVFDYFVEQMRARGYREMFRCAGRGCGSSEYWANDIFGKRILYGPVRNQYYLAMASQPPGRFYISAYVVTRSNRQLLAFLEIVELDGAAHAAAAGPELLLEQLRAAGAARAPALRFDAEDRLLDASGLDAVVEALRLDPQLRLFIVAHLQGGGAVERLLERSASRAEAVSQALVEAGIDPARLTARGLGPLAPLCAAGDCAERVEFVPRSVDQ